MKCNYPFSALVRTRDEFMMISKSIQAIAIVALCLASNVSFAGKCDNPQTENDLRICISTELNAENSAINSVYEQYRLMLDDSQKAQFKTVQVSWIRYRDAVCEFDASPVKGGSMHATVHTQCMIEQTKLRRKQLEELIRCDSNTTPGCF